MPRPGLTVASSRDAAARWVATFWKWPRSAITLASSAIVIGVLWFVGDAQAVQQRMLVVAAGLIVPAVSFLWFLATAPSRVWRDANKTIDTLEEQQRERALAKDLAARLEDAHRRGTELLVETQKHTGGIGAHIPIGWPTRLLAWYTATLELVATINEDERFMFSSLRPPPPADVFSPTEEYNNLLARLNKLRMITNRIYGKARGAASSSELSEQD